MKTLYLVRHARSRDDDSVDDHDRPLDPQGERQAEALGRYLIQERLKPDAVLCSTALRAADTARRLAAQLGNAAVTADRRLYLANPDAMLARLREAAPAESVLMVGHNPGCSVLARRLAPRGDPSGLAAIRQGFPTAALAVITLSSPEWQAVRFGDGQIDRFVALEAPD